MGEWFVQHENMTERQTGVSVRSIAEWTMRATEYIRFQPDRAVVAEELKASYEDHRDALIEAGETRDRASFLALQAMGDPDEAGELLAKVHKPWLGWAWKVSRWAAVFAVIGMMIIWQDYYEYEPYVLSEEGIRSYEIIKEGVRNQRFSAGDYRIHVTDWKLLHHLPDDEDKGYFAVILLDASAPPWLTAPSSMQKYMQAEDNSGTAYRNVPYEERPDDATGDPALEPVFELLYAGRSFFTQNFYFLVHNCDPDAEWIRFSYNHGGTAFSFTVPFSEDTQ